MSILVEQDPQQVKDAFALYTKAEIVGVRLVESEIRCLVDPRAFPPISDITFRYTPEAAEVEKQALTVTTRFSFRAIAGKRKKRDVMAIDCLFASQYDLMPGYQPTTAEVDAFRTGNAVFNCWPFFREFVQNMVVRMDLPAPPIPFLWLAPKRAVEKPKREIEKPKQEDEKAVTT